MESNKYQRKHGKLRRVRTVVLDEFMDSKIQEAIDNNFEFQAWVRDLLRENFETVLEFAKGHKTKHA